MMPRESRWISSIPNGLIVFAVILLLAFGAILAMEGMGEESSEGAEYKTYTSEEYEFSFSYPSDWIMENWESQGVLLVSVGENTSQGKLNATIRVYAGSLGMSSLDNVRELVTSGAENNENLTITTGPENVAIEGVPGLELTLRVTSLQGRFKARRIILSGENSDYDMISVARENSYEDFKPDLEHAFESFTLLNSQMEK